MLNLVNLTKIQQRIDAIMATAPVAEVTYASVTGPFPKYADQPAWDGEGADLGNGQVAVISGNFSASLGMMAQGDAGEDLRPGVYSKEGSSGSKGAKYLRPLSEQEAHLAQSAIEGEQKQRKWWAEVYPELDKLKDELKAARKAAVDAMCLEYPKVVVSAAMDDDVAMREIMTHQRLKWAAEAVYKWLGKGNFSDWAEKPDSEACKNLEAVIRDEIDLRIADGRLTVHIRRGSGTADYAWGAYFQVPSVKSELHGFKVRVSGDGVSLYNQNESCLAAKIFTEAAGERNLDPNMSGDVFEVPIKDLFWRSLGTIELDRSTVIAGPV